MRRRPPRCATGHSCLAAGHSGRRRCRRGSGDTWDRRARRQAGTEGQRQWKRGCLAQWKRGCLAYGAAERMRRMLRKRDASGAAEAIQDAARVEQLDGLARLVSQLPQLGLDATRGHGHAPWDHRGRGGREHADAARHERGRDGPEREGSRVHEARHDQGAHGQHRCEEGAAGDEDRLEQDRAAHALARRLLREAAHLARRVAHLHTLCQVGLVVEDRARRARHAHRCVRHDEAEWPEPRHPRDGDQRADGDRACGRGRYGVGLEHALAVEGARGVCVVAVARGGRVALVEPCAPQGGATVRPTSPIGDLPETIPRAHAVVIGAKALRRKADGIGCCSTGCIALSQTQCARSVSLALARPDRSVSAAAWTSVSDSSTPAGW
eukprot:scaffold94093_cov60-Phaeocystis_antarctica.AAC.2